MLFGLGFSLARSWSCGRLGFHGLFQLLFPNLNITDGGEGSPLKIGGFWVRFDKPTRHLFFLLFHLNERVAGNFRRNFFFGSVFWIFLGKFVRKQGPQPLPVVFKESVLAVKTWRLLRQNALH